MELELLPETFAVCRSPADADLPAWLGGALQSVTRTPEELSIVCEAQRVPEPLQAERDWRCLRVSGTLAFHLTGILAALTAPLANAGISIFALSTFDTDYLLVTSDCLEQAVAALTVAGHTVRKAA